MSNLPEFSDRPVIKTDPLGPGVDGWSYDSPNDSLICMTCGCEFWVYVEAIPTCPRCKSTDIDIPLIDD